MRKVDIPGRVGFYAFCGTAVTSGHHVVEYASIFQVERAPVGSGLAVRTSYHVRRPVEQFTGTWWAVDLPFEVQEQEG